MEKIRNKMDELFQTPHLLAFNDNNNDEGNVSEFPDFDVPLLLIFANTVKNLMVYVQMALWTSKIDMFYHFLIEVPL